MGFLTIAQLTEGIANHTITPPLWWNPLLSPAGSYFCSIQNQQKIYQEGLKEGDFSQKDPDQDDDTSGWSGTLQNATTFSNGALNLNSVAK